MLIVLDEWLGRFGSFSGESLRSFHRCSVKLLSSLSVWLFFSWSYYNVQLNPVSYPFKLSLGSKFTAVASA